ncbi:MAG: hypothetical protein OER80_08980 [Gammaproteobacteria bacterium]|nr:hypothetical protein [Gammaproteobacteria bacterium]MDH3768716.1 hypothetical protein [Gammaproteobacteria bacterium]
MESRNKVLAVANLREFFHDSLDTALSNQRVDAADHTAHYIVNLLTLYSRADELYDTTSEGRQIKPLAFMLADALEADTLNDRDRALRRLGDVALFMAGFFVHSFSRKLIDVDYYISMGGGAYSHLSETTGGHAGFRDVFVELAEKFQRFVDVLNEISAMSCGNNDEDILRLYEIWMRTGSPRAAAQLRCLGVEPSFYSVSLLTQ